jgi:thiol-disulfide isomerase/thioredoxin
MLSVSLGPFALPVAPLLLALAVWAASWLATRLAGRGAGPDSSIAAGNAVLNAALIGLLAARLAHLLLHADLYLAAPWSALDIRDGGWHLPTGVVVGVAWLAWQGWRTPELRRPLAVGSVVGMVLWSAALAVISLDRARELPPLLLIELEGGAPITLFQAARGRPVVVNLWASWCGPCRKEMPILAAAQQRESTVGFLFVNQGEADGTVRAYMAKEGLPLREVLLDAGSQLGPAVGSRGLPTTLFYDARGRQVDAHVGVLNAAALESRLRRLRGVR